MSTTSSASTIVSFRGEELELDEALNALYIEIQQQLNYSQCSVRQLASSSEQDNDFLIAVGIHFELMDHVESLMGMFKELQTVSLQCLGKPPKEFRDAYKTMCDDRKALKIKEKEAAKELAIQSK